jgi:hypothetical protein
VGRKTAQVVSVGVKAASAQAAKPVKQEAKSNEPTKKKQ